MEFPSVKSIFVLASVVMVTSAASLSKIKRDVSLQEYEHPPWRSYFIAYACERTMLDISCSTTIGNGVISIVRVTYGRQRMGQCNEGTMSTEGWSTHCVASPRRSQRVVAERCNGRRTCRIPAINYLFRDPCPNTYKYLEVYYACLSDVGINDLIAAS